MNSVPTDNSLQFTNQFFSLHGCNSIIIQNNIRSIRTMKISQEYLKIICQLNHICVLIKNLLLLIKIHIYFAVEIQLKIILKFCNTVAMQLNELCCGLYISKISCLKQTLLCVVKCILSIKIIV